VEIRHLNVEIEEPLNADNGKKIQSFDARITKVCFIEMKFKQGLKIWRQLPHVNSCSASKINLHYSRKEIILAINLNQNHRQPQTETDFWTFQNKTKNTISTIRLLCWRLFKSGNNILLTLP